MLATAAKSRSLQQVSSSRIISWKGNLFFEFPTRFRLHVTKREATILEAAVVLNDTLNYNQRMVYHFQIEATDGPHKTQTTFEARVKDVQDKPPVFQGSLSTVIDEDSQPTQNMVQTENI